MNMNGLIVVQARIGSTRLPRKILRTINGLPMLYHVIKRAEQLGRVVVATPDDPGPTDNVLQRFINVAHAYPEVDLFVRITADCPLLDVALARQVVATWTPEWDIVGTTPSMDGLDVEVFTRHALMSAKDCVVPEEAAHVTPWMRRKLRFKPFTIPGTYRWSVDDESGLQFVRDVYAACGLCANGTPHHSNAANSIGGADRVPVWDLHHRPEGDLAECAAADILATRMGGEVYCSV
jgi:spore coat polysaccharide biosynthesis protein SpsF (cytidylyltransferase family)